MKRYLLRRTLFAIFSLLVVTGTVMFMTYNLINPDTILQGDPNKTKYKDNELEIYKHNAFRDAGYEILSRKRMRALRKRRSGT